MASLDENTASANSGTKRALRILIFARLLVVILLIATTRIWFIDRAGFGFGAFPSELMPMILGSFGLTIGYYLLSHLPGRSTWQIWLQFIIDTVFISWLVWQTGDLSSPYITLFIVLISISSIFLRRSATLLMAVVCVAFLVGLVMVTSFGLIPSSGTPQTFAKTAQILSFHIVAFLVVGLLAARLADRRLSGEKLAEATKTIANLRALHERIIESIRSGLITTDLDGTIYTFNTAASEITGYTAAEAAGRSIFDIFGDISQSIELSLNGGFDHDQVPRFEADLVSPEGFAIRVGYSISRLYSERGEPSGLIITFQDLTEIRSMEESIRRTDRLAAVGRVAAGLAHEIRNPLGAMRGAIQVLESNTPPESIHADLMKIILSESDRLNNIITNFLSYARPKAGNFSTTDLGEAIRDTIQLIRHSPDVKENHIFTDNLPKEPIYVSADVTQLKQIFWNLARNALNAMPGGGELSITTEPSPNDRVKIYFADTGLGMSPEQVEQLFEPFSTSTSGGTGLGLSIVYQIVKDHNGAINVRSSEGEGTVITIELPREKDRKNGEESIEEKAANDAPLADFLKVESTPGDISS